MATAADLPPLPAYTLKPLLPLLPPIPDKIFAAIIPQIVYWAVSLVYVWIDYKDYFPQYRLHTPIEVLKRNRATPYQVLRDVLLQQVIQIMTGVAMALLEPQDMYGAEAYELACWARRVRLAQRGIPLLLSFMGIDAVRVGKGLGAGHPMLAGAFLGGQYPSLQHLAAVADEPNTATFQGYAPWEMLLARVIYYFLKPAVHFAIAIVVLDAWQYFIHRGMHMNKYLYNKIHSRHHRLYVPYAYGALYNHPLEAFFLDVLGTGVAYMISGLTTRQSMLFYSFATAKTVDDHCGYAFPWDPLQHITGNNAGYHDVHHQSWGIKANFSQPFFTFWDRMLGTAWTGGDVSARYAKSRLAAQKAYDADLFSSSSITNSDPAASLSESLKPYDSSLSADEHDVTSALPPKNRAPAAPRGKAAAQAIASRAQVLNDTSGAGGASVVTAESREEARAAADLRGGEAGSPVRRSPRKRAK